MARNDCKKTIAMKYRRLLWYCWLVLLCTIHASQKNFPYKLRCSQAREETQDEEKEEKKEDPLPQYIPPALNQDYIVLRKPAIFITGCQRYVSKKHKNAKKYNLKAVKQDLYNSANLFDTEYDYEHIWCTYDYQNHINGNPSGKITKQLFQENFDKMLAASEETDSVIFIFCGHGSRNYLFFHGFEYIAIKDIQYQLVQHFGGNKPKIMFLLACRTNDPDDIKPSAVKHLASKENYDRLYTVRNTIDGFTAEEYKHKGSLFMQAFVQQAQISNYISLQDIINSVGKKLKHSSSKQKELIEESITLREKVFLHKTRHTYRKEIYEQAFYNPAKQHTIQNPYLMPKMPHNERYIADRDKQLKKIHNNFQQYPQQVLHGVQGVGKSVLARLYGEKYGRSQNKYQYICWCNVDTRDNYLQSLKDISINLGITYNDKPFLPQYQQHIHQHIKELNKKTLIVFDNATAADYTTFLPLFTQIPFVHVLYTSTQDKNKWKAQHKELITYEVKQLSTAESLDILANYKKYSDNDKPSIRFFLEKNVQKLPIVITQLGHYLKQGSSYKKCMDTFTQQKKTYSQNKKKVDNICQDIVVSFEMLYELLDASVQQQVKQEERANIEPLRILRVLSYLNAEGLSKVIFDHLRPSRKDYYNRSNVEDKDKTIAQGMHRNPQVIAAIKTLYNYGILLDDDQQNQIEDYQKLRIHRSIQAIMQWKMTTHTTRYLYFLTTTNNITPYIQDQAIQLLETLIKQSPYAAKKLRYNLLAHAKALLGQSYTDQLQYLRLLAIVGNAEGFDYRTGELYLDPLDTQGKKVGDQVSTHIENQEKSILVTGSAGTGKSTYFAHLLQKLWQEFFEKRHRHITLFVSLPTYATHKHIPTDLIEQVLSNKGVSNKLIKELRKKYTWIFLIDGYDEIHCQQNLYEHLNLNTWHTKPQAPTPICLISCRDTYLFAQNGDQIKDIQKLFGIGKLQRYQQISIALFDKKKLDGYIADFAESKYNKSTYTITTTTKQVYTYELTDKEKNKWQQNHPHDQLNCIKEAWKASKYTRVMHQEQMLPLLDMMRTPFLLVMGLQILPNIYQEGKAVTLYNIYKAFHQAWITRETNKPYIKVKKSDITQFCQDLALALFKKEKYHIDKQHYDLLKHLDNKDNLNSAPIRKNKQGHYIFIQPSYRDFFVLSSLIPPHNFAQDHTLTQQQVQTIVQAAKQFGIVETMLEVCQKLVKKAQQTNQYSIEHINAIRMLCCFEPNKLLNLSNSNFTYCDLTGIDFTKCTITGGNFTNAMINEVTLPKNLSNINFTGQDLSKHDLQGCNLTGAKLNKVMLPKNLSNINFTGQDLSKHDLQGCNLTGANLNKVILPKNLSNINFTGQDLSKHDLQGCNLTGVNLNKVTLPKNLSNINFTACDLTGFDLSKHVITGGNFTNAEIKNTILPLNLTNVNLSGTNLSGMYLTQHKLQGCNLYKTNITHTILPQNLSGTNLSGQDLTQHILQRCNLFNDKLVAGFLGVLNLKKNTLKPIKIIITYLVTWDLQKANLEEANLQKANLQKAYLQKAYLQKANLEEANLQKADLQEAYLEEADLYGANLEEAKLQKAYLQYAKLQDAYLQKAYLQKANLYGANLEEAKLQKADLYGANLQYANLQDAYLQKADLQYANLQDAYLQKADLQDAYLQKADLQYAYLQKANLYGANLEEANLQDANLQYAKMKRADIKKYGLEGRGLIPVD